MKTRLIKLLMLALLFCAAIPVSAQPKVKGYGTTWVSMSKLYIPENVPILDIRTKATQKTKSKYVFSFQDKQVVVDANKWQYYVKGTKQKYDLTKLAPDNEGYYHVDLNALGFSDGVYAASTDNVGGIMEILVRISDLPFVDPKYYFAERQNRSLLVEDYRKLAQSSSDKEALYALATLLEAGDESEQKEAFEWWQKLEELGDSRAYPHLAMYYIEGKYVERDVTKAGTMLALADDDDWRAVTLRGKNYGWEDFQASVREEGFRIEWNFVFDDFIDKYPIFDETNIEFLNHLLQSDRNKFHKKYMRKIEHNPNHPIMLKLKKALMSGKCDWLWFDLVIEHGSGYDNNIDYSLYGMSPIIWYALGFDRYRGSYKQFAALIERLCDIALQTQDKELTKCIVRYFFSMKAEFDLGEYKPTHPNPIDSRQWAWVGSQNKNVYRINEIKDIAIKNKILQVFKLGIDLGVDKCDQAYERYYLGM